MMRGRKPTASKTWSERVAPKLSPRRERELIKAQLEAIAARQAGGDPTKIASPRHSEQENIALAQECMRFLWLREHAWSAKSSVMLDIMRYADEQRRRSWAQRFGRDAPPEKDNKGLAERMFAYLVKKQKVRIWKPNSKLRTGDQVVTYRAGEFGDDAPYMRFILKI